MAGYNKANYQKNTNMVAKNKDLPATPGLQKVKTDGRIGSPTPTSYTKGAFTVDNNRKMGPPNGALGSNAARHMSASHTGNVWSPRVTKARRMAKPNPKPYANPVNVDRPSLKKVKPQ